MKNEEKKNNSAMRKGAPPALSLFSKKTFNALVAEYDESGFSVGSELRCGAGEELLNHGAHLGGREILPIRHSDFACQRESEYVGDGFTGVRLAMDGIREDAFK